MLRYLVVVLAIVLLPTMAAATSSVRVFSATEGIYLMSDKVEKTDQEWQEQLSPAQFHILREKGTERAYSGSLHENHEDGIYRCAGCGLELFSSAEKYDSGTGWPSYYAPIAKENVTFAKDKSFFMTRTEVLCTRCASHLGHVFGDGPAPSGQRYCINAAALTFDPKR